MKKLFKFLLGIIKAIQLKILYNISTDKYLKKIGINFVSGGTHLYGSVKWGSEPWIITIGNNVHITDNCRFITHDGGTLIYRQYITDLEITKPIVVGNNVYMGVNTVILPGAHIGNNVVIGSCSVVTKDIPDNSVAVGIPARVIKTADDYFEKLQQESLHLGHLKGKEKDKALRKYYGYTKN